MFFKNNLISELNSDLFQLDHLLEMNYEYIEIFLLGDFQQHFHFQVLPYHMTMEFYME